MQSNVIPADKVGLPELHGKLLVNEVFYSVQGEGVLAGTPMVFVRFSKCNLRCSVKNAGFDCDTEFESGVPMGADTLVGLIKSVGPTSCWVLFTGGEPGLQLTEGLVSAVKAAGYKTSCETNGTVANPAFDLLDHVCVSPKSAVHTIRLRKATEVKFVRQTGQGIPVDIGVRADYYLISPAFNADGSVSSADLGYCVNLVKENPPWRLSLQMHKFLGVR